MSQANKIMSNQEDIAGQKQVSLEKKVLKDILRTNSNTQNQYKPSESETDVNNTTNQNVTIVNTTTTTQVQSSRKNTKNANDNNNFPVPDDMLVEEGMTVVQNDGKKKPHKIQKNKKKYPFLKSNPCPPDKSRSQHRLKHAENWKRKRQSQQNRRNSELSKTASTFLRIEAVGQKRTFQTCLPWKRSHKGLLEQIFTM